MAFRIPPSAAYLAAGAVGVGAGIHVTRSANESLGTAAPPGEGAWRVSTLGLMVGGPAALLTVLGSNMRTTSARPMWMAAALVATASLGLVAGAQGVALLGDRPT